MRIIAKCLQFLFLLILMIPGVIAQDSQLQVFDADGEEIGSLKVLENQEGKYVLLEEINKILGGVRKYEPLIGRVTLTMMGKKIIITLSNRQVKIDDKEYSLSKPPVSISGKVVVPEEFLTRILPRVIGKRVTLDRKSGTLQIDQEQSGKSDKQETALSVLSESKIPEFRVIIDPGHGGFDIGAKNNTGLLEKDLTFEIAQQINEMLSGKEGIEVFLTRNEDKYIIPEDRTNFANNLRGEVFVSIHFNWSPSANFKGFGIYVNSSRIRLTDLGAASNVKSDTSESAEFKGSLSLSKSLSNGIKSRLESIGLTGEREKEVPLTVMNGLFMPGVLVEVAYLSNPKDMETISKPDFIKLVSQALCESILAFRSSIKR